MQQDEVSKTQEQESKQNQDAEELSEIEELRRKLANGEITEEELRRLRELEDKHGLEHAKDPNDNEDEVNQSRITDQDNFQELPPVEVMNNLNKA